MLLVAGGQPEAGGDDIGGLVVAMELRNLNNLRLVMKTERMIDNGGS